MISTEIPVQDLEEVVQEQLSDEMIWHLCKERAAELHVPAWQIAESMTWH